MESFTVDASEVMALANRIEGAPRIIKTELTEGMRQSTQLVTQKARQLAPKGATKELSTRIDPQVRVMGLGVEGIVTARAPHAEAIEKGRRAFGPVNKKALRFEIGGKVVFAKWVRAAPAQPFMAPALQQSELEIRATFRRAANRAIEQILGGV